MNTLKETADFIASHNNFIIIGHKNPDGDCVGSCSALCMALRSLGKNAAVVFPSPVPKRLYFIWDDALSDVNFKAECAISVDVASDYMMNDLYDNIYIKAKYRICIDHHGTNGGFGDVNYVDAKSAAAGEIVYDLINSMPAEISKEAAACLLVSIADDTGCFQYSNTTAKTHLTAAALYEKGIEADKIMKRLFGTNTREEMNILKIFTDHMEYYFDDKVCISHITAEEVSGCGADMAQVDAWVGMPRSVSGVEAGVVFKIYSEKEVKVSLRSNEYTDVSAVAAAFGGGGHARAAGVTMYEPYESAKEKILAALEKLV